MGKKLIKKLGNLTDSCSQEAQEYANESLGLGIMTQDSHY